MVRLEAVILPDRSRVAITPPAILRCTMAEAIADWVREEAAPRVLALGAALKGVENLTSFDCRGRNGVVGAKLSEHGKANALDIHSLKLASGKAVVLTDPQVSSEFREGLRKSTCERFTTVLGPGSDGFHEDHIHVDILQRRAGYRICEWDVREPGVALAANAYVTSVPLPRARPRSLSAANAIGIRILARRNSHGGRRCRKCPMAGRPLSPNRPGERHAGAFERAGESQA